MCYAIPAKVVGTKENEAWVEYFGRRRKVRRDLIHIRPGDYVYVQAGMAISRIGRKEAEKILRLWQGLFHKLRRRDEILSRAGPGQGAPSDFRQAPGRGSLPKRLSQADSLYFLSPAGREKTAAFCRLANGLRSEYLGNCCCVHGVIEMSNFCAGNCLYCGIRKDNRSLRRYRMREEEIVGLVGQGVNKYGFRAFVLQSGEDGFYTRNRVLRIIRKIRRMFPVLIFLSLGERPFGDYYDFYAAGARGALLRFETANPSLYSRLRPGRSLGQRLRLIYELKKIGYILATGFLCGLPKEDDRDILNNILLTKRISADMVSFGPFIPHPRTPLAGQRAMPLDKVLRIIALMRIIDRRSSILVTTATETLARQARGAGLRAGANSLMVNLTPLARRRLYDIYPRFEADKQASDADALIRREIAAVVRLLRSLGRAPIAL
ncbi:MAG: HypC/HybG/HupF family hydrogenase formation chaperone [Candidatus Omnitrophota bacterium]